MADCVQEIGLTSVSYNLFPNDNKDTFEAKCEEYKEQLLPIMLPYIWQREPLVLKFNESLGAIEGCTDFGDNIEDEWFIVYLLTELTRSDPELVVKIEDSDGEFLLIEAANVIPRWLNPSTSENRTYLHRGQLHIIPKPSSSNSAIPLPLETPTISDAIAIVRNNPELTKASDAIQQVINKRIQGYPQRITDAHHFTHCYIPYGVAAILKQEPSLLSSAVQAFYYRDPLDLKVCRTMKYFPPEMRVKTGITFTKCLYGQLMQQKFIPDRITGWNLPPETSPEFKAADLGMKLACGFEILASQSKSPDLILQTEFSTDKQWFHFLKSLQDKNYFRDEVEGSKLYMELLEKAKSFYRKEHVSPSSGPPDRIRCYLKNLPFCYEELKRAEKTLPPAQDDSWLNMSMEELEELLESRYGAGMPKEDIGPKMTSTLQGFLEQLSNIEGVEVPEEKDQGDTEMYKNILDFSLPEDPENGSSSGMSDYSDDDEDEINAEKVDPVMEKYMSQLDRELAKTQVDKSFKKKEIIDDDIDDEEDEDGYRPVDIELNALTNMLESYKSQQGNTGPAENLFSSLGIKLPLDKD